MTCSSNYRDCFISCCFFDNTSIRILMATVNIRICVHNLTSEYGRYRDVEKIQTICTIYKVSEIGEVNY